MPKEDDWFRNDRWDAGEETEFFNRLSRCRSTRSKAQYARIKAVGLSRSGDPIRIRAAIDLVNRVVREWPVDTELAACHWLLAESQATLGHLEEAIEAFRTCFRQEKAVPTALTRAWAGFGRFVVEHGLKPLYDEALEALEANLNHSPFPADRFVQHAVRSIIWSERGQPTEARQEAGLALAQAMRDDSGMAKHPTVGLVQGEALLMKKVRAILEGLS